MAADKCYLSNTIRCRGLLRVFREIRVIRDSDKRVTITLHTHANPGYLVLGFSSRVYHKR